METETYKNAKLILERFDPEAKKKAVSAIVYLFILLIIKCSYNYLLLYLCLTFGVLFFLLSWGRSSTQLRCVLR